MSTTTDKNIIKTSKFVKRHHHIVTNPAVALTNAVIAMKKFADKEKFLGADAYCRAITVDATLDFRLVGACDRAIPAILAIDAVPEKFKLITNTVIFTVDGVFKSKAPATAIAFSAAHVITANKWGAILVQIAANGTVSTKVAAATQAYASEAEALAALPDADASRTKLGYIMINNNAVDWTAQTDDMTNASDVTTATFNNYGVRKPLTGAITPLALQTVAGVVSETANDVNILENDHLVVIATTDADAALTDGSVHVVTRPRTLRADVGD